MCFQARRDDDDDGDGVAGSLGGASGCGFNTKKTMDVILTSDTIKYCVLYFMFSDKQLIFDDFYLFSI